MEISLIKNPQKNYLFIKIFKFKKRINPTLLAKNNKEKINKSITKVKNAGSKKIKNTFGSSKNNKKESLIKLKNNLGIINQENLKHILNFLIQLFSKLRADKFKLELLFSTSDPYYNGLFLAFYYSIKEIFNFKNFRAEICWGEIKLETEIEIAGRIILSKLFFELLKFIFSFKTLKILRKIYKNR